MLVFQDGSILGTVGGGCGEAEVWQEAMEVFETRCPRRVEVDLTEDQSSDSGKVCGGRFEVFLDLWTPDSSALTCLARVLEEEQLALLVTYLGPVPCRAWKKVSPTLPMDPQLSDWKLGETRVLPHHDASERPCLRLESGHEYFCDPLGRSLELVIAGAGHIARPLSQMAQICGYRVKVIDDRPEYARSEFFPQAQVDCADFAEYFSRLEVGAGSHIVLITRGHKYDEVCLRALKDRTPDYLGMIGSRRRTRAVLEELRQEGCSPQWLKRIYAPVGLDIGALTPEEIAVSILSEMILLRRGGKGGSLRLPREE